MRGLCFCRLHCLFQFNIDALIVFMVAHVTYRQDKKSAAGIQCYLKARITSDNFSLFRVVLMGCTLGKCCAVMGTMPSSSHLNTAVQSQCKVGLKCHIDSFWQLTDNAHLRRTLSSVIRAWIQPKCSYLHSVLGKNVDLMVFSRITVGVFSVTWKKLICGFLCTQFLRHEQHDRDRGP